MCGRATVVDPDGLDQTVYGFTRKFVPGDIRPRYNIRPTEPIPVVRVARDGERELLEMRWGLIPFWAKEPTMKGPTFNARADTVAEKPMFRAPFEKRRCLVVVDGFYEWPRKPSKDKRPRHIRFADRRSFALAAVWDRWKDPVTGIRVESVAVITTEANDLLASVPHERMPVILDRDAQSAWLDTADTGSDEIKSLLTPHSSSGMELVITSQEFVNYGIDDARCIEPV
jgi:putative SOS response-associated peptidase YedK